MSTYILVHGAWHGAWCWQKLVPLLAAKGHKVIAPDLPGLGQDKTPVKEVSFKSYTDRIGDLVLKQDGPVILVGHSMAGMIISQLAEYMPKKIKRLVYVTAMLPRNGEFLLYLAEKLPAGLLSSRPSENNSALTLTDECIEPALYSDCYKADVEMATSLLVPQALAPFSTAVRLSKENFGKVRKTYICCTEDKALPIEAQEMMLVATPCNQVLSITSGHSPFLSAPNQMAELLLPL